MNTVCNYAGLENDGTSGLTENAGGLPLGPSVRHFTPSIARPWPHKAGSINPASPQILPGYRRCKYKTGGSEKHLREVGLNWRARTPEQVGTLKRAP